uniref:Tumor protein D52 family protein n=1 Tax=Onchocerca volvulus TaxID=6282 RepID=A0A2K6VYI7_ONCVO
MLSAQVMIPPKRPPPPQELSRVRKSKANTVNSQELSSLGRKKDAQMQDAMDKFADELNKSSDDEENVIEAGDEHFINGTSVELSEVEKELIREELKKTEEEINTLRQVLIARQKHASDLKRKLGISPFTEFTADINQSLQHVKESQAYQKTSEVVAGTADTVKSKWNDMRNSSLFKSFESKLGSAYTNAKMAASTSIDQISGMAKSSSGTSSQADPTSPSNEKMQL